MPGFWANKISSSRSVLVQAARGQMSRQLLDVCAWGSRKKTEGQSEAGNERATVTCFDFSCGLCNMLNTEEFQETSQKSKCISCILEIV